MKKLLILVLVVSMVVSLFLAGCTPAETATDTDEADQGTETEGADEAQDADDTASDDTADNEGTEEEAFNTADHSLGFVCWNRNHPTVQIMEAGFLARADELGYQNELYVSVEANLADAVALGEQAIAAECDGLVIYVLDESMKSLIKDAADAGIAVVTGHTMLTGQQDEYEGLLAWAACDPVLYAETAAEAIGSQIGGTGAVAITQGGFNPTENAVAEAFVAYMDENYPDIDVLDPIEEGFESAEAARRASALIQANPDIAGAFSTTGNGAATWANAMQQAGVEGLCIIAMDYSRQNLDLISDGTVYGIIAQPIYEEHALCVDLLDQVLRGETISFDNLMDAPLVTAENVDEFYAKLDVVDEYFGKTE